MVPVRLRTCRPPREAAVRRTSLRSCLALVGILWLRASSVAQVPQTVITFDDLPVGTRLAGPIGTTGLSLNGVRVRGDLPTHSGTHAATAQYCDGPEFCFWSLGGVLT